MANMYIDKRYNKQNISQKSPLPLEQNLPDRRSPGETHGVCRDSLASQVHGHILRLHSDSNPLRESAQPALNCASSYSY